MERGDIPDSNLTAVARGEDKLIVRAEEEGGHSFGIAFDGRPDGGVRRLDDLDGVVARAHDERGVGRDGVRAAGVELAQGLKAPIISLQRHRRRHEFNGDEGGEGFRVLGSFSEIALKW